MCWNIFIPTEIKIFIYSLSGKTLKSVSRMKLLCYRRAADLVKLPTMALEIRRVITSSRNLTTSGQKTCIPMNWPPVKLYGSEKL